MTHKIKLSNGQTLVVEELDNEIAIATEDEHSTIDMFICCIQSDGVLVYPNSGSATNIITEGLKEHNTDNAK